MHLSAGILGTARRVAGRRIATAELAAEHAEQLMIAATVSRIPNDGRPATGRVADAVASVMTYLAAIGVADDAADRADLAAVLAGAFPDFDQAVVAGYLETGDGPA